MDGKPDNTKKFRLLRRKAQPGDLSKGPGPTPDEPLITDVTSLEEVQPVGQESGDRPQKLPRQRIFPRRRVQKTPLANDTRIAPDSQRIAATTRRPILPSLARRARTVAQSTRKKKGAKVAEVQNVTLSENTPDPTDLTEITAAQPSELTELNQPITTAQPSELTELDQLITAAQPSDPTELNQPITATKPPPDKKQTGRRHTVAENERLFIVRCWIKKKKDHTAEAFVWFLHEIGIDIAVRTLFEWQKEFRDRGLINPIDLD